MRARSVGGGVEGVWNVVRWENKKWVASMSDHRGETRTPENKVTSQKEKNGNQARPQKIRGTIEGRVKVQKQRRKYWRPEKRKPVFLGKHKTEKGSE